MRETEYEKGPALNVVLQETVDDTALVVDLDHTLIRTDLLYESFLGTISAAPQRLFPILGALPRGKAAVKAEIADHWDIDPAGLPYNQSVVDEINQAREQGRKVILVSAADDRFVRAVSEHLGLFDEAHGSDGTRNLGGHRKAAFLTERFGQGGYDYVGDATVDAPVWQAARTAITYGAGKKVREIAEASGSARHIDPRRAGGPIPTEYLKALRPHQWLKNLLIFLPLLAAHDFSAGNIAVAIVAFVAFSLTASSVYVLNDLLDLAADRAHPRKRFRPFACGAVPLSHGVMMTGGFLLMAIVAAMFAGPLFLGVLAIYYVATLAYSMALKRRRVIDICMLAGLYTMRVIAGAAATGLVLSPWMLAFSVFLFLALAAVKRQAELVDSRDSGKEAIAGRGYTAGDLPVVEMMGMAAGYNAVLVLALYISSQATVGLYSSPIMLWGTCPILLYWISRMVMIAHNGEMHDDPVIFAVRDRVSQLCGLAILACGLAATFI